MCVMTIALARILALACLGGAWAQTLEVASVKPSRSSAAGSNIDSVQGRLSATNITVKELIRLAYGVRDYQIGQAPGWVNSERFDIAAKMVTGAGHSLQDEKSLVRELLAERFQLTTHLEPKQMQVYLLVVAKGGPRLMAHDEAAPKIRAGCGRLIGRRVTAETVATMLSRQLEREVLNRTGLAGEYDVQLNFAPESGPCQADASGFPSIHTALQEQLGLKLEAAKGPVDVLVIDRVERPGEN